MIIKNTYNLPLALVGCVLISGLAACSHVTPPQKTADTTTMGSNTTINKATPAAAKSRQQQLMALHNWQTQGAVGVIRNQGKGFSGSFNWAQQSESYRVSIFAPLGAGSAYLVGNPTQVSLVDSKNRRATATSAEALLQKQLGITIPVSNLYYWMRGLPTPNGEAQTQFDSQQRLVSLHQDGWQISYQHYTAVNGLDLPDRMVLTSAGMQVKFVIKQWSV